jgi:hypothetical protein
LPSRGNVVWGEAPGVGRADKVLLFIVVGRLFLLGGGALRGVA